MSWANVSRKYTLETTLCTVTFTHCETPYTVILKQYFTHSGKKKQLMAQ